MESFLNDSINDVFARVQSLESSSKAGPPPKKRAIHHRVRDWADREGNTDLDDLPPAALGWSNHEEDNEQEETPAAVFLSLSEEDRAFLVSAFTSTLPNMERRK
uniref:Uncharacterized protein n=1 Tax=Amphimedon queenslandica TaxID=400682 RepID=A0A1X7V2T9_AMPQE